MQHIVKNICAVVAHVRPVVHRWLAGVEPHLGRVYWREFLNLAGEGVEKFEHR